MVPLSLLCDGKTKPGQVEWLFGNEFRTYSVYKIRLCLKNKGLQLVFSQLLVLLHRVGRPLCLDFVQKSSIYKNYFFWKMKSDVAYTEQYMASLICLSLRWSATRRRTFVKLIHNNNHVWLSPLSPRSNNRFSETTANGRFEFWIFLIKRVTCFVGFFFWGPGKCCFLDNKIKHIKWCLFWINGYGKDLISSQQKLLSSSSCFKVIWLEQFHSRNSSQLSEHILVLPKTTNNLKQFFTILKLLYNCYLYVIAKKE